MNRRIETLSVLPIFYKLDGKRAVLIGGTAAAAWKAELLAAAGAHVDIFASKASKEMLNLVSNGAAQGSLRLVSRSWTSGDLAGTALLVADAATLSEVQAIRKAARVSGVPVNIIDKPEFCQFQFGSIVNRSPVVIGISTAGAAPVLGQEARSRIEAVIPTYVASWARIAARLRSTIRERFATGRQRRKFWADFARRAMSRPPNDAEMDRLSLGDVSTGSVTIISVEDAGDLSLREIRALQRADAIYVNGRSPAGVLEFARREANRMSGCCAAGNVDISSEPPDHDVVIIEGDTSGVLPIA